ncbi:hypothetical protein ZWY2020_043320 [Hordeum vulgare]|nr:hypothetical protein ZWY2020_043320 [Hordeum vulgare]
MNLKEEKKVETFKLLMKAMENKLNLEERRTMIEERKAMHEEKERLAVPRLHCRRGFDSGSALPLPRADPEADVDATHSYMNISIHNLGLDKTNHKIDSVAESVGSIKHLQLGRSVPKEDRIRSGKPKAVADGDGNSNRKQKQKAPSTPQAEAAAQPTHIYSAHWTMFFDGSKMLNGSGAGVVIISPKVLAVATEQEPPPSSSSSATRACSSAPSDSVEEVAETSKRLTDKHCTLDTWFFPRAHPQ